LKIENLVDLLLSVVDDSSSVAVKFALNSMHTCIGALLQSVHSDLGLHAILKLLEVKDNPYWLVKVNSIASNHTIFKIAVCD